MTLERLEENSLNTRTGISTGLMRSDPMFAETAVDHGDMEQINRLAPAVLKTSQVYVRSMYLCSSQPCLADGCQFTRNALAEIAERIVGQSVLSGHDRSSLPLARFYKAAVVQQGQDEEGQPVYFVRAWFYWMRETSGAKDLMVNIDGGIYREVSLAWKYETWRCSVCNSPNGMCGHRVGNVYNGKRCFRLIEHITDVLEGSVVYKSADRNTLLSGMRGMEEIREGEPLTIIIDSDDPQFERMQTAGILEDLRDLNECEDLFTHGVDRLWVCGEDAFIQRCMARYLIDQGVGVGEGRGAPSLSIYPQGIVSGEFALDREVS